MQNNLKVGATVALRKIRDDTNLHILMLKTDESFVFVSG